MFNSFARILEKKNEYQQPVSQDLLANKQQEHVVELRKKQRQSAITQKRLLTQQNAEVTPFLSSLHPALKDASSPAQALAQLRSILDSSVSSAAVSSALSACRALISQPGNSLAQTFVNSGFVPMLLQLAQCAEYEEEATWVLCNIAAGNSQCAAALFENGVFSILQRLICRTDHQSTLEHCLWCLSNLAVDSQLLRKELVEKVLPDLLTLTWVSASNLVLVIKILSSVARECQTMSDCVEFLATALEHNDDSVVVAALSGLTECVKHSALLPLQVLQSGLRYLEYGESPALEGALRLVGNMAVQENIDVLFECGVLEKLEPLLGHRVDSIRCTAFWTLSNLAVSDAYYIGCIVEHPIILEALKGYDDPSAAVIVETSYLFYNITHIGTHDQIVDVIRHGLVSSMLPAFHEPPDTVLYNVLKTLTSCLETEEAASVRSSCEQFDILSCIEPLCYRLNPHISSLALEILTL